MLNYCEFYHEFITVLAIYLNIAILPTISCKVAHFSHFQRLANASTGTH